MCWWTENSRGQIQLAFNSCFSLKRSSFKQTQFVMKINFRVELLSVWERLTPTGWGGNVEGTLTTSRNPLLPSYVMYISSPQDNQCHACQQYIKQNNPFFTLPLCDWRPPVSQGPTESLQPSPWMCFVLLWSLSSENLKTFYVCSWFSGLHSIPRK